MTKTSNFTAGQKLGAYFSLAVAGVIVGSSLISGLDQTVKSVSYMANKVSAAVLR